MTADGQASTLNYLLGNLGGRRKSWMTDASPASAMTGHGIPPVPPPGRRRGRRPKQAPLLPRPQQLPTQLPTDSPAPPSSNAHAERQPPSKSTSPQLANTIAPPPHPLLHGPSAVTVFPSPTPSKENTPNASITMSHEAEPMPSAGVGPLPLPPVPANNVPVGSVLHPQNAERPIPFIISDAVSSTPSVSHLQHLRRPSMPQMPTSRFSLDQTHHHRRTSLGHQMNSQAFSPPAQHMHLIDPHRVGTPPQVPPQVPPQQAAPPTTGDPASIQDVMSPPLPTVRTVPSSNNWYTSVECMTILNAFEAASPAPRQCGQDWTRLAVLKNAIEEQDWAYLTMHQYYCLLNANPNVLPQSLLHQPSLNTAVGMMQNVLDSNEILTPAVLAFFANFPYPLEKLSARWPDSFQRQGQLFLLTISQSPSYGPLKILCERRKIPPLARELAIDLRIHSATFQRLLFTTCLRCIWGHTVYCPLQARFEKDAVAIFQQNQVDFYRRETLAFQTHTLGHQYHEQEKVFELQSWGSALKQLGDAFERSLQRQAPPSVALTNQRTAAPPQLCSPTSSQHPQIQTQTGALLASGFTQMPPGPNAARHRRGHPLGSADRPRPLQPATQQPQPSPQQTRPAVPLLPPPGWLQPQQRIPNPGRFSLHQAHLRSPVLKTMSLTSPLYHYLEGYAQHPVRLTNASQAIQRWTFTLTRTEMQAVPKLDPGVPGGPDVRIIDNNSKTVRLRCIKWPGDEMPTDHAWAVADTAWVPYSFFTFNGQSLQQRKKVHNGRDLPIDVTRLLKKGENVLEVAITAQTHDISHLKYLIAIEILGVVSHESIKQNCLNSNRVAATEVVQGIQNKLSNSGNEDDEIAVVESNLTINLFDPFSASKMCAIPVRSVACLHDDCFDLETFLQTRRRKGDASVPDQWRCPTCNADARPQHLVVDGFLEDVTKILIGQGLSDTRAIIVQQNGSWKPKVEARDLNSVSDRGRSTEPSTPAARSPAPVPVEIIDLCD